MAVKKTNKLGSKVTVKGEGTKANTEYSGTNIKTIIAQTGDDTTIDVKLAKDLTGINSISNTAAGPKMEFGGNSINITGGNLDLGSNKITNLGPATSGSDAVNYDQLKNSRTVVTSTDGSVTVTPTTSGDKTTYDLKVATTGTVAKSTWNIASDKVSATEGTVAAGSGAAQNIADTKTVTMQAGKNLTVNQTNDGNGNASVAFALDKDLKDLTSVTTDKVTTKEIGLQDTAGNTTTIKKDGDRITYTNDGGTTVNKVANLADEKHITKGEYDVDADGKVTMTYTDGNGTVVTGETAVIKGIAKQDLSNINNAGKNVITGLGSIVKAGDNVTVSEASDATTGQKTYTVNAVTPAVYTKADGTKVVKRPDGTYTTNVDGSAGNDVPASDVIVSFQDAAGNTTGGNSIVNNVGSAIDKTGTSTGDTFLTKLDTAATDTPNAAVNVKDLKNTSDAIIGKGLKFDANDGGEKTNKLGSKVTVKGEGTKANTEYSGTNIKTIIAQTGDDTTIDVKLAKDLTGINSISNTAAGPKMEFGGNSINITGGNLDLGSNKITNLGPATSGSDAVNYDQLKNSRTVVTSTDGSVTVTPTTSGDKTTYDLKVATTGTVAKSTWNIASDKVSATEGTVAAGSGAAQNIADTKTVTMQAGKNLTVNQTNDGNGNASVAFALDKDLKDLTSVTTDKVTTKEIGLQDTAGNTTTIKKDGDRITYTNDGGTTVNKVANLADEKHITKGEYDVDADGKVTMTYTDGNGTVVTGETAVIKGIAKQDLSNINNAGKNVITGLGTIVKAGDNVTVSEASDATTGQKTYTVNAVTPAVYTKADGTKVVKRPDGTYTTNVDGSAGNDVPASDVIVSFQDAAGNTTGGNSIVNNVGSAIDKTGTSTGDTFLTKLDTAATDTPNAAVNVKDLKNTSDAIIGKGLKFDANDGGEKTNKLGSKVTVKGEGTKANTEYSGTNIKTIIAQTGDDTTIDVKLAKDLTGINSISNTATGPKMEFGGNSINITGGNLDLGGSKITNLGPATNGTDAVNYDQLKSAKTVVKAGSNVTVNKTTGANGEDVYTVNATGGTGGAASTWNLNTGVASATEGTHSGDTTQNIADTKSVTLQAGKNLTVKQTNDGNGNTDVAYSLDSDLKDLTSVTTEKVTTKEIGLKDAAGNTTTIKKDGDRITYTNDGGTTNKTVATLDDEMHIKDTTYTVDGNKKVTLTYVDGNGTDVAGKKAIIDLSGLPVGDKDTDMRIKDGNYTATNGSVTLNTVDKDGNTVAGKDVVIKGINTNNYVAGDNVTFTNNGNDANGNPIVKINAEVSTEQVVAKAGNDNLATVAPATGSTQGGKNATYEVNVDKTNLENKAEISYKANGGTAQKTTLAKGFNFTSDDNSVAITTGADGKVNFKVDTSNVQGKAFNLDVNKEGTGKVENAQTAAATPSVEKGTKFVAGNNLSIRHDGINGDANYDHQVTYALNSDLKGITSITNNGGATMNFGPNEVSITGGNLNMGGNKITNVKNGTDKSDVATVGQLTKVTSNDNTVAINKTTDADGAPVYDLSVQGGGHDPRVDQLGEEVGRVGAQGAALAALKPIQYDPLEPTQIMAGYGNYRGNSAIAMGVAHYKNESTLMHAGVSWAGGSRHMMANAGVTWKVGNRDSEAAVADRYRKGPISSAYAMQQEMASVKAQNAGLKTEVSDLKAENEQMKAQIAAMMAKLGM
ncbi:YadA-like family protein [Veillonella rogosae]|uniref:YadA-like family protein n=1 Tax=Veillonella rogosae TaxID=423477 RepID=UPI002366500C|nr:YadA-like family protein [Veillonella rogosae]